MSSKVGRKIAALRKKHNLTQAQLAEKLHLTDKAISKWETSNSEPSIETINKICEIFNIKETELIGDKPVTKSYKRAISIGLKFLKNNWLNIIFGILFILLLIYFISNFNRTQMYKIKIEDKTIQIENGYFIASKEVNVLALSNMNIEIKNEEEIVSKKIKLYTLVNNDKTYFYESENLKDIFIEDYHNEVLTEKIIKNISTNLNLELELLTKENKVITQKYNLGLVKIIDSDNLIYKTSKYSSEARSLYVIENIEASTLLKNGYTRVDKSQNYYKTFDNYRIYFDLDLKKMSYISVENNIEVEIIYNYSAEILEYKKVNIKSDKIINFRYYIDKNELNCKSGNCENYKDILEEVLSIFNKQIQ